MTTRRWNSYLSKALMFCSREQLEQARARRPVAASRRRCAPRRRGSRSRRRARVEHAGHRARGVLAARVVARVVGDVPQHVDRSSELADDGNVHPTPRPPSRCACAATRPSGCRTSGGCGRRPTARPGSSPSSTACSRMAGMILIMSTSFGQTRTQLAQVVHNHRSGSSSRSSPRRTLGCSLRGP